jgi:hypothetical protein
MLTIYDWEICLGGIFLLMGLTKRGRPKSQGGYRVKPRVGVRGSKNTKTMVQDEPYKSPELSHSKNRARRGLFFTTFSIFVLVSGARFR